MPGGWYNDGTEADDIPSGTISMADERYGNSDRRFEMESPDGDGDTVRILPEPYDVGQFGEQAESRREGSRSIRPGTLYTPASTPPIEAYAPSEQANSRPERQQTPTSSAEKQTVVQVRRGPSGCAILAGTFSLLLLSCALLAYAGFQGGLDSLGKLSGVFPKLDLSMTPTVTIDTSRPSVIEKIRALSKLETVHYQMEKVVSGKSTTALPEFLVSDKILLVAHGEVVAGIDLGKVGPEDIVVSGDSVVITVPSPEILYSKLDNDKTYVYDRQTGIFSKPDPNLETEIRKTAEQEIVKAALEDDILGKARVNGEQVIRTLITGLGYPQVEIRQEEP